jgi:hypothetical protein
VIKVERPPNFEAILAAFPSAGGYGVLFAWGDDIYNPSGVVIPAALLAHEAVHGSRQRGQGGHASGPLIWWDRYINEPAFRYHEELLAHAAEYKFQLKDVGSDRNRRARLLTSTAQRLIAPLYNYPAGAHTLSTALRDLRWEIENG